MRRVAIIGAEFAPSNLPPSLRIRFFAGHLREFGWEPVVITARPEHYEWSVDPENERLLPGWLEVIRTPALSARFTRKLGIGDIGMRSMWYHWRVLSKLCRHRKIDMVFIPVPPNVPMVLGRWAYRRFGVPYVIDYIDPWVTEYHRKLPRAQRPRKWLPDYLLARLLEPYTLRHASHIIGVSQGTTDSVISRYPWLTQADTTEIPYGGEPADFDYVLKHPRRNLIFDAEDGLIHISYVGACIPAMHNTVRALFQAAKMGLERSSQIFSRLRLHFVGTTYAAHAGQDYQVMPIAEEMGVHGLVDEHPERVPYLDALQVLLDSHALAIIGSEFPHYTASKVFPYILARRPLLAIFHEASSVVKILKETQAGDVVTFSSEQKPVMHAAAISRYLEELICLPRGYQPPTRWEAFEAYTARAMSRRLAGVLDKVIEGKRARKKRQPV
jgi:hypothetical protein